MWFNQAIPHEPEQPLVGCRQLFYLCCGFGFVLVVYHMVNRKLILVIGIVGFLVGYSDYSNLVIKEFTSYI